MRARIAKRGARGIAGIGKKFKIADDNRSGSLDREEFKKANEDLLKIQAEMALKEKEEERNRL